MKLSNALTGLGIGLLSTACLGTTTYPSPPDVLESTPQEGALLVVDADLSAALNSYGLTWAKLIAESDPPVELRMRNLSRGWLKTGGLILFEIDAPGSYRLVGLGGNNANGSIEFSLAPAEELLYRVDPGNLVYSGVVTARAKMLQRHPEVEVQRNRGREREAWEEIMKEYPSSPWSSRIEAHIATLR